MKVKLRFFLFVVLTLLLAFLLSSCSPVVVNSVDELTLNNWSTTLDNGSEISLSFSVDYATLTLSTNDKEKTTISGLCECDNDSFIIYDEVCNIPYSFSYIVHFDSVEIIYGQNTVSLDKVEE